MGRILALDYGSKRVGLSISDDLKIIAQILEPNLSNDDKFFRNLLLIIKKYEIEKILVGHARSMKGNDEKAGEITKKFAEEIRKKTSTDTELVDERLSTVEAGHFLRQLGMKASIRKANIDNQSAQIILQQYLDSHRS